MNIGVVFPQTEIGADRGAIRSYAERVEELGFTHLLAYDHVLGADPEVHAPWHGPYNVDTTFHEPFVLFGYLAAITTLELVTGIIILPQRQTALVAKQAAEVDLLTDGRFRLGVGLGWNAVEYDALGTNFTDRGRRSVEQVELLRRLWTERSVTFAGELRARDRARASRRCRCSGRSRSGSAPSSEPAFRRAGRIADGWFPMMPPGPALDAARAVVEQAARDAGRDPASLGMEGRVSWTDAGVDKVVDHVGRWRAAGATHVAVNTMNAGLGSVDGHLAALAAAAEALALS